MHEVNARPKPRLRRTRRRILVVDVGGTNVKMRVKGQKEAAKIPSGPDHDGLQSRRNRQTKHQGWDFNCISLGISRARSSTAVRLREPHNLGGGWVGFDFQKAFGVPVKLINDAAMQALGSYKGGRMLFLGLGTGLGSAMIVDGVLEPMELAHLLYKNGKTYEDYLGLRGLRALGQKALAQEVDKVTEMLKASLGADYVVLGGGNIKKLKELPPGALLGANENAFLGGLRLWEQGAKRPAIIDIGSGNRKASA